MTKGSVALCVLATFGLLAVEVGGAWGHAAAPTGDALADWLRSLTFGLPGATFETPLGPLVLQASTCSRVNIGGFQLQDLGGSPSAVQLGMTLTGLTLSCTVRGEEGTLVIHYSVSVDTFLTVGLHAAANAGGDALPLGRLSVDACNFGVTLGTIEFSGTSDMVENLQANREVWPTVVNEAARGEGCSMLKSTVEAIGSEALVLLSKYVDALENGDAGIWSINPEVQMGQMAAVTNRVAHQAGMVGSLVPVAGETPAWQPLRRLSAALFGGVAPPAPPSSALAMDWGSFPPLLLGSVLVAGRPAAIGHAAGLVPPLAFPVQNQFNNLTGRGIFSVAIDFVEVAGIDTLVPSSVRLKGSAGSIGVTASLADFRITAGVRLQAEPHSEPIFSWDRLDLPMNFTVGLAGLSADVSITALLREANIAALMVDQLQDLGCIIGCSAASPGESFWVESISALATPRVNVGGGPGLAQRLARAVDVAAAAVLRGHDATGQALVKSGAAAVVPKLGVELRELLDSQAWTCGASAVFLGAGKTQLYVLLAGSVVIVLFVSALCIAGAVLSTSKRQSNPGEEDLYQAPPRSASDDTLMTRGSSTSPLLLEDGSLAADPMVPPFLARCFPIVCLVTFFLFVFSQSTLGTVVNVVFTAGEKTWTVPNTFTFALYTSAYDSWRAGAYMIALATLFVTGIWPFVKLALMLYCWQATEEHLSTSSRGRILTFVDEYGKYSLIDTFIATFAFAAYRIEWKDGDRSVLVEPCPEPGFFAYILATVISLVLGHVAAEMHNRCMEVGNRSVSSRCLSDDQSLRPLYMQASPGTLPFLGPLLMLTSVIITLSAFTHTFTIAAAGVAASLVGDEDVLTKEYSFYSFALGITGGLSSPPATLIELQLVLVLFAFVVPHVLVASLFCLWAVPMTRAQQKRGLLVTRILHSWASWDVFVIAVAISRLELHKFAAYIVYDGNIAQVCDWVRDQMQASCFEVNCLIEPGYALMVLSGVLSVVIPRAALNACIAAMRHRPGEDDEASEDVSISLYEEDGASSRAECRNLMPCSPVAGKDKHEVVVTSLTGANASFEELEVGDRPAFCRLSPFCEGLPSPAAASERRGRLGHSPRKGGGDLTRELAPGHNEGRVPMLLARRESSSN